MSYNADPDDSTDEWPCLPPYPAEPAAFDDDAAAPAAEPSHLMAPDSPYGPCLWLSALVLATAAVCGFVWLAGRLLGGH